MFRRLIQAYRPARMAAPSASARPRWRPAVEQLECRLAPSMTPLSGHLDIVVAQPTEVSPIHVAISQPDQGVRGLLVEPVTAIKAATPESLPLCTEAPCSPSDRAEFFALTVVEQETQRLVPESTPSSAASTPANQVVLPQPSPAPSSLPLLVWVFGMTCLLMLRWERRIGGPVLSRATAGWARCRKRLADLPTIFRQVGHSRAPPACI